MSGLLYVPESGQGSSDPGKSDGVMIQLCGAVSMFFLLGIPWLFSGFGAIDATTSASQLAFMEGVFHVRNFSTSGDTNGFRTSTLVAV